MISGNTDHITIEDADQGLVDRLDIKDLKIESYLSIESFTGTSLEFLKNVNVERSIYVDKCDNLEVLPEMIGTDKYSIMTLYLPKNMEEKVKVPEDVNYRVIFKN